MLGEIPEHLQPPILSYENIYSLELWTLIKGQLRATFGEIYGLDLGAIATVFEKIGVSDIKWQLEKMNMIFDESYKKDK